MPTRATGWEALPVVVDPTPHADLVRRIALKIAGTGPLGRQHLDDYQGAGMLGLLQAARTYRLDMRASFRTFAGHRIRGAILNHIQAQRALGGTVRSHGATCVRASLRSLDVMREGAFDPPAEAMDTHVSESLLLAVMYLACTPREAFMIRETFFEGRRVGEAGRELGVSASRASTIRNKALRRMRAFLDRSKLLAGG